MQLKAKIRTNIPVITGNRLFPNQNNNRDNYASMISNNYPQNNNATYRSTHTSTNDIQQKKEPVRYVHHYPKQIISHYSKNEHLNAKQTDSVYHPLPLPSDKIYIGDQLKGSKKPPAVQNQAKKENSWHNEMYLFEQRKPQNKNSSFSKGKLQIVRIDSFEDKEDEESDNKVSESKQKEVSLNFITDSRQQKQKGREPFMNNSKHQILQRSGQSKFKISQHQSELYELTNKIKSTEQERNNLINQNERFIKEVQHLKQSLKTQEQILLQKSNQIITLQTSCQKTEDSLRISRSIIFNLNQKINNADKKYENIMRNNEKAYAEKQKKHLQLLCESIFQQEKAKYDQFIKSLQKDNKHALEQKEKEVQQIKRQFELANNQYKLTLQKLQKQLIKIDKQNIRLDQQNLRFHQDNQHLIDRLTNLNQEIINFCKEKDTFQQEKKQLIIDIQDKKLQIIQLNASRNKALLQIFELKDFINTFKKRDDIQGKMIDEKQLTSQSVEYLNNKYQTLLQQQNKNKAVLQAKTKKINQLEQELKKVQLHVHKKTFQMSSAQNINLQKEAEIIKLKVEVSQLKAEISTFKSEAAFKEQFRNQKLEQFSVKQKKFQEFENQYRQVLEDELKKIEMIDQESNDNEQMFSEFYSPSKSSSSSQYFKTENFSDQQGDEDSQHGRQRLVRKIKQLIYINRTLSAKIEEISQMQNFEQMKQLQQNLYKNQQQKNDLEKNFIEVNIRLRKLADKCAFYQAKIEQLQQNVKILEINLEHTTDDLIRSGLRLMEIKFAQKLTKQASQQNCIHEPCFQIFKKQTISISDKYIPVQAPEQTNKGRYSQQIKKLTSQKQGCFQQEKKCIPPLNNIIPQKNLQLNISTEGTRKQKNNKNSQKEIQSIISKQSQFTSIPTTELSQTLPKQEKYNFKSKQKNKLTDYFLEKKTNNPAFNRLGSLPLQIQSKNTQSEDQRRQFFQHLAETAAMAAKQSQSYRSFLDRELKKMRD